jgi:hypothetical protein
MFVNDGAPVGLPALTLADNGTRLVPSTDRDWREWVSATATRNFLLDDTLIDWLDLYGRDHGFQPDAELANYDARTDFTEFLFGKAKEFELAVVEYLKTLTDVVTIASERGDSRRLEKAEDTFHAIASGAPVIYQPVLRNPQNRTYGMPDLLVRSDELLKLFPGLFPSAEGEVPAAGIGAVNWHYRVVDIKFTMLDFLAGGGLGNGGSNIAYKGQLYIYNRALARVQGYLPATAYVLGRSWVQVIKGQTSRGRDCLERLGPVTNESLIQGQPLDNLADEACAWVRLVRENGHNWVVLPEPSVPQLRPNMGTNDSTWSTAKSRIADELHELTLLWYVGFGKRCAANDAGIYRWNDPNCTAAALGVTGATVQPTLQAILDINRTDGPLVAPPKVTAAQEQWRATPALEFYVDFETVNDLDDDFSRIPERGGQPLIFMIGCGHIECGQWQFRCFTADALTEDCEEVIIDAWLAHMRAVRERLAPTGETPLAIHWSPAETSNLTNAYNAAIARHPHRAAEWSAGPNWFDFLKHVIKAQPVVVRGAWGFGLKALTQAMYEHGLIGTQWTDGPTDGLGAMLGAWWCAREAAQAGVSLRDIEFMREIEQYNEVDCKAMMEIVAYLRGHH